MIEFRDVTKRFPDGTVAVDDLNLTADGGKITVFVGPSGCGKTTSLRMVNRMIDPSSGTIIVNGIDVLRTNPSRLRRRIGYVIQQVGLFPHRTVLDNIATVPMLLGTKKPRARQRAAELMELVGLPPELGKRYPAQLSGGQQQRVGVARALAADPPVLLMDEPFGAVDPIVRTRLQDQFLDIQANLAKTVVFVTHDIEEAVRLGDRVAVFEKGGRLAQFDTPARVLGGPADEFVAEFVGADRGLRRLAVTPIEQVDLERAPVAHVDDPLSEAHLSMDAEDARWAIVLDADNRLRGWIGVDDCDGGGTVGDRAERMEAWVPMDASLKEALAIMLQWDAGWVAVLDRDQFLGVLTPATLHEALRRSVGAEHRGVEPEDVTVSSTGPLH
ncbi:MAG: ATP-binding cassette domain-containing protein [Actinomycetota bacterium]|nr:ATP-binding cassette domain-containing protein [Actinomycetota bacterium]